MEEDWADRHVARWRDHWLDMHFDDATEAAMVRIGRIQRYLHREKQRAVAEVGLTDFEYDTLHVLMIRDTPGTANPTELADDLGVSGAGMTGRLDGLVKKGWVRRTQSVDDRRKVLVEATKEGIEIWRSAMEIRGSAEADLVTALTDRELATLNRLLKKLTLRSEQ